jgi:hypothetical protein
LNPVDIHRAFLLGANAEAHLPGPHE